MEVIIDTREKCIINKLKENRDILVQQLNIGDIIIKYNNDIVIIIERKTIKDLSASIKDGRYREQKKRLLENYPSTKIYYLIEGEYESNKYLLPNKTIISSMLNIMIRDNIKVIRTNSLNQSIEYLEILFDKVSKNFNELFNNNSEDKTYISTLKVKKKDNLTPSICFQLQLNQIPGVSNNISNCVLKTYNSMYKLISTYNTLETEKDKLSLLENLKYDIANNKQRKVGKVISNRIYNYLVCN